MLRLCLILSLIFSAAGLYPHPSWGIAVTSNGDVYFADVLHNGIGTIWKVDQSGNVTEVLTDFHAHYLQLDQEGNLWVAENRWIQGVVEGDGEHTLLKITPDGERETLIFTDDLDNFVGNAFAMGTNNNVYFALEKQIWNRPFNAEPELLFAHTFKRIVSLYTDDTGDLWITDTEYKGGTLFRWNRTSGLTEYATNLLPEDPATPIFKEKRFHLLYDIKKDETGYLYVCDNASRQVQRINTKGEAEVFYTSPDDWYPAGIDFYEGLPIIMEIGFISGTGHLGPRIIKITGDGEKRVLFDYGTYKKSR